MTAKILVIEDDLVTRKMLVKNLESFGFITIQSSNGKHGWETLWENPDIRLIITDMMMPDMDGRELMLILRGNQSFRDLPVIITSGVTDQSGVADLLKLGHASFCPKPLDMRELKSTLSTMLNPAG